MGHRSLSSSEETRMRILLAHGHINLRTVIIISAMSGIRSEEERLGVFRLLLCALFSEMLASNCLELKEARRFSLTVSR